MSSIESSIPAVLGERARQQSDAPAYTFIDYEVDPAGYSQSLTWSQAHRRAQVVAGELASCRSPDVDLEASLKDLGVGSPQVADALSGTTRWGSFLVDVTAFDVEFFEISPTMEIWSKGWVGV
jgi:hypothetical protein